MAYAQIRRQAADLNNRLHNPAVLPYLLGGQIFVAGGFALEYTRRALGLDAAGYYVTGGGLDTPVKEGNKRGGDPNWTAPGSSKRQKTRDTPDGLDEVRRNYRDTPSDTPPEKMDSSGGQQHTSPAAAALRAGTGNGEDPVQPFGVVADYAPDYFTVRGKACGAAEFSGAPVNLTTGETTGTAANGEWQIRLNSPADWNVTATGSVPANTEMNGFDLWKGLYSHYRLLQTKVKLTFFKKHVVYGMVAVGGTTSVTNKFMEYANSAPVSVGYVADPSNRLGTQLLGKNFAEIRNGKHVHFEAMMHGMTSMTYVYTPGKWDQSIETTQEDGIWTATNTNPSTQDILHILVIPHTQGAIYQMEVMVELEMLVQFKQFTDATLTAIYTGTITGVAGG